MRLPRCALSAPAGVDAFGKAIFGTFIYTGQLFDGYRAYEMPYAGKPLPSVTSTLLYLYYLYGHKQWVIGPVVGSSRLRFAFVSSTADLPELIGLSAGGDDVDKLASWSVGSWSDTPRFGLFEESVTADAEVKVECVQHPVMPPTPPPVKSLSHELAKRQIAEHAQEVARLGKQMHTLTLCVVGAAVLLVAICVIFVRAGNANRVQQVQDVYGYEAVSRSEADAQRQRPGSPTLRKRSHRISFGL